MIKIADIYVSDDGCGNYVLRLRGTDAAYFTISNKQLYFRDDVGTSPRIYNAIVSLENLPNTVTPISRNFSVDRRNCTTTTSTTTSQPTTTAAPSAVTNTANFNSCADWDGQNGNVTTVGTNGGPSAYGTYDQSGNLNEINDLNATSAGSLRSFRGGAFNNGVAYLSSATAIGFSLYATVSSYSLGFRLASSYSSLNPLNLSNFVVVGDVNNIADDITNKGSVSYVYAIGKYEITNNEYAEFLNAVAKLDSYQLYNINMGTNGRGINRSGTNGNFSYSVETNYGNKPVNWINWLNAARYANWVHNGKPTGNQNSSTTEDGAYTLNGEMLNGVARNAGAKYHIPTENEWYKAAYYKGGGTSAGYWKYATQSDTYPTCVSASSVGDGQP